MTGDVTRRPADVQPRGRTGRRSEAPRLEPLFAQTPFLFTPSRREACGRVFAKAAVIAAIRP